MGGDGAIYSSIDGVTMNPLAEVDNCSRVIKYLVTLGHRYSSETLLDMRIHDVNVVADLDRANPNAEYPVENDGTPEGLKPCAAATSFVETLLGMSTANTISWWTGWWPVLHVRTSGILESGATYSYLVAVDILGAGTFEGMTIDTVVDDDLSDAQLEAMAQGGVVEFLADGFRPETVLAFSTSVIMFTIDVLLAKLPVSPTPVHLGLLAILLASYSTVMLLALAALWDGILTQRLKPSVVAYALMTLIGTLIMQGYWNWGRMCVIWAKCWNLKALLVHGLRTVAFCLLSFLILAVKAFFIGVMSGMIVRCYELWCMGW